VSAASFAEVAEGVRAAIAAYAQALDDGRTEDVVAAFCPDGTVDIPGLGVHSGHDALRAAFAAVEPKVPQRHLVLNTLVTEWGDEAAAATSDLAFAVKGGGGWSIALVGRYHDTLHRHDGVWRFHRRRVEWAD
jgi:uncharacterized protein (TIGR02246 family)